MNRLAIKRLATRAYRLVPRDRRRRVVLSYHAVGCGPWSTPEREFAQQIEWLREHTHVHPLDQLLNAAPTSDDIQVAITFDDGYQSVLTKAKPVLDRAGMSATVFVSTSQISDKVRSMSDDSLGYYRGESFLLWGELRELRGAGWGVESHGHEHPDLARATEPSIRDQLTRSKQVIEERLAGPCVGLAYPFGRFDSRVQRIAAESGYQWAVCSTHGTLKPTTNRFAVPRIDIRNNYSLPDFAAAVQGDLDYLHAVQTLRHRFRFYR